MGTFEHLPFHELLVVRLGEVRRRIFERAAHRLAALRGTGIRETTQLFMARAELQGLWSLASKPWESFLYFHLHVHLRMTHSWISQDQRDTDTAKALLSQLLAELEAVAARADDSGFFPLDLPSDHELRARQELLFLESETLIALLDFQRRPFGSTWRTKILEIQARLQVILDAIKTKDWPNDQRVSWLVSLDDAAPFRLIKELDLVLARDAEDPDAIDLAHAVLVRAFEWLGGDLPSARPCRHGRTNLIVAQGLVRQGKLRDAALLLRSFIEAEAQLLNPQRVLATIREQRAAKELMEAFDLERR